MLLQFQHGLDIRPTCHLSWLLIFIIFAWIGSALAIQCFVCDAAHFNFECNNTENVRQCPITYDTCMTMIRYSSDVGKLQISKRCSKRESCSRQNDALGKHAPCDSNQTGEWACTHCCDTHDLCNANAAAAGSQNGRLGLITAALATAMVHGKLFPFLWSC